MLAAMRQNSWLQSLLHWFPAYFIENTFMQIFGLAKVPMLFFLQPKVVELSAETCVIKIPLTWRSKNHLNCMYFGALAAGADCAGGFMAMKIAYDQKLPVNILFKDFHADFMRRAEGHVYFVCEDGEAVSRMMQEAAASGERQNLPVTIVAYVPSDKPAEPVARFTLTLSAKRRSQHG
jgi:acyl-coenzyme A thioesterase PaaI-like protein